MFRTHFRILADPVDMELFAQAFEFRIPGHERSLLPDGCGGGEAVRAGQGVDRLDTGRGDDVLERIIERHDRQTWKDDVQEIVGRLDTAFPGDDIEHFAHVNGIDEEVRVPRLHEIQDSGVKERE